MEGRRRGFIGSMAGWTRTEWKPLLVALAISLALHGALLATRHPAREGDARPPLLVVRLVPPGPLARSPGAAAAAATSTQPIPQRATSTQPIPQRAAVDPAQARPAKALPAPARASVPPPAAPAAAAATPAADPAVEAPLPDDSLNAESAATPVSTPELGEVARQVSGRRLQATIWVSAEGRVEKAFVKRNELAEEVARSLEQALASVRFTPARRDGQPVPSVLDTRLCFDAAGVLDTASAECLRPARSDSAPPENR